MGTARQIFILSDLHIGGAYPTAEHPRGFRMMTRADALTRFVLGLAERAEPTELVVNGDFVDFLAEQTEDGFHSFTSDPAAAVRRLDDIVARDRALFDAFGAVLARGHRLTVLLGNHDLELSLPAVRERFLEHLGARDGAAFSFVYDGEAYVVGDALIEHGNRYDGFNVVDHDALRRLRSWQSRGLPWDARVAFTAPPGSRLVAEVMNGIKREYPFIDLLKPETEAAIPVLLAIDPGLRRHLAKILLLKNEAARHDPIAPAEPRHDGDIGATTPGDLAPAPADPLEGALRAVMTDAATRRLLGDLPAEAEDPGGDVSGGSLSTGLSLLRLALKRSSAEPERWPEALESRLPTLLEALRIVQRDRSFDTEVETDPRLVEAAVKIAQGGFKWVVFGHTHLAKKVRLDTTEQGRTLGLRREATYLNTGTWADLIRFPKDLFDKDPKAALAGVRQLVLDMKGDGYRKWITFEPTYVRLDFDGRRVTAADLVRPGDPR